MVPQKDLREPLNHRATPELIELVETANLPAIQTEKKNNKTKANELKADSVADKKGV